MKLIVRTKGGLGNQLYAYAAAKRLAYYNNAELIIDDVTGFKRDKLYNSQYLLDYFSIKERKATWLERMEPFERIRRGIRKKIQSKLPFEKRNYIEQEFADFDPRIINLALSKDVYIDGLWQSLEYFKDIQDIIKQDLMMDAPKDIKNLDMAEKILSSNSVAMHIRWFSSNLESTDNVSPAYYAKAIEVILNKIERPHFFVFSDNIELVQKNIDFSKIQVTFITHNTTQESSVFDFWLMRQCNHFIIANSTFSWWASWLSDYNEKIVIYPKLPENKKDQWSWDYKGQMPHSWLPILI